MVTVKSPCAESTGGCAQRALYTERCVQLPWYGDGGSEYRDLEVTRGSHEAKDFFLVKERQVWAYKEKLLRRKGIKKI